MEKHECQNCFFTGELDVHGKCARCGSAQVVSVQVLTYLMNQKYEQLFGDGSIGPSTI